MHKARARRSPPFARGNSALFVVATEKLTGTHALRQARVYPSSMRGNAKNPNHKHAVELPGFDVQRAKLVWITLLTIATRRRAGRIVLEYAKASRGKLDLVKSFGHP